MNTQTNDTNATISAAVTTAFAHYNAEKAISFVSKHDPKTQVNEGFRLAVVRYRDTSGKAAKPAQQVVIPQLVIPQSIQFSCFDDPAETEEAGKARELLGQKALEVFVGCLEDAQDSMIRAYIDSGVSLIEWAELTADKCIEFLTAARVSERLTKERVQAWVPVALGAVLNHRSAEICQQKGYEKDSEQWKKQHAGTINAYCEAFGKLAAAVPNLKENEARALVALLGKEVSIIRDNEPCIVGNPQDDVAKALRKKLDAILKPVILENTDL